MLFLCDWLLFHFYFLRLYFLFIRLTELLFCLCFYCVCESVCSNFVLSLLLAYNFLYNSFRQHRFYLLWYLFLSILYNGFRMILTCLYRILRSLFVSILFIYRSIVFLLVVILPYPVYLSIFSRFSFLLSVFNIFFVLLLFHRNNINKKLGVSFRDLWGCMLLFFSNHISLLPFFFIFFFLLHVVLLVFKTFFRLYLCRQYVYISNSETFTSLCCTL